ncbi:MAG: hypothetical protein ACFE89_03445 [Candidatus Hodarchaeota archaeon]
MGTVDTARALTIIGTVYNVFVLFFMGMLIIFAPFLMFFGAIWILLGFILPIVAYRDISRGKHGPAGTLLIISGVFSLIFIFYIGGVCLIIAGALTADFDPYRRMRVGYQQHMYNPPPQYRPLYAMPVTTARTKKCVNCGVDLDRWDQYCHTCGAHTGWY